MTREEILRLAFEKASNPLDAMELAERMAKFLSADECRPLALAAPAPAPAPEPEPVAEVIAEATPIGKVFNNGIRRRKWMPEEATRAAALLDNGMTPAQVGKAVNRTAKAISQAVGVGTIPCKVYSGDPVRMAAGYKSAIMRGRNLSNWDKAQKIIDAHPTLKD